MTSLFARLGTLTAFVNLSSSGLRFLPRALFRKTAQRRPPSAVVGVCALLLGAVCAPARAQTNWMQESQAGRPFERDSHAMAYDPRTVT
jgi:hypothetical protein